MHEVTILTQSVSCMIFNQVNAIVIKQNCHENEVVHHVSHQLKV